MAPATATAVRPRAGRAETATFTELEFGGLPEPVCRYFASAIALGVPLDSAVTFDLRGRVRRRHWLPFQARYDLECGLDFVGVGHRGELAVGVERFAAGRAQQVLRLGGLLELRRRSGPHVSRSTAARAALGAVMLPTALLPRNGVRWTARSEHVIEAALRVHDVFVCLRLTLDGHGRPLTAVVDRWGDPTRSGTWGLHPFGAVFTGEAAVDGLTVPSAGHAGWFVGTDRPADGTTLRFRLVSLRRHRCARRGPAEPRRRSILTVAPDTPRCRRPLSAAATLGAPGGRMPAPARAADPSRREVPTPVGG